MFDELIGLSILFMLLLIFILQWGIKHSIDRCSLNLEIIAFDHNKKLPIDDMKFMEFINDKNILKAIKRYRKLIKAELKEANDYVNKLVIESENT